MDRPQPRPFLTSLALLVAALASGCGDAPTDPEDRGGTLTEAEALGLAGQMGVEWIAFGRSNDPLQAPSAVPTRPQTTTISVDYDFARSCVLGGSVRSSGTIRVESDEATQLAIVDITATDVHHACVFLAGGTRVAVTGDPDVTTTIHVASLGQEAQGTQSVSVLGGLLFETEDGRSGHCDVDVLVEVNAQEAREVVRGGFCGFSFDVTVQG